MKQLFLTSDVADVAADIAQKIQTKSGALKTAYITTALERGHDDDDLAWHKYNKQSMEDAGFDVFEYTITGKSIEEMRADLTSVDVVYVEGGSLVWMLQQVRETGFDVLVKEMINAGTPYIGTSTGSFIMAPDTEAGLALENYFEADFDSKGLGVVNFLLMPHWGTDDFADQYPTVATEYYHTSTPMITITDKSYVWVQDDQCKLVTVT